MRRAIALATLLGSFGCAAPFRGGYTIRGALPVGEKSIATFLPGHCEDGAHQSRAAHIKAVELVETETGQQLLLERRQGYELLVVENHFNDGSDTVFQVVLSTGALVREWRIPHSLQQTGTLRVGRELRELSHGSSFEAELASVRLTCSLLPQRSDLPLAATQAEPRAAAR